MTLFWCLVLAALVTAAVREYQQTKVREALADLGEKQCAAIERGMVDDHACELCHAHAPVRELVTLHDDATLACPSCAALLKGVAA